jgi:hypothetical protein
MTEFVFKRGALHTGVDALSRVSSLVAGKGGTGETRKQLMMKPRQQFCMVSTIRR